MWKKIFIYLTIFFIISMILFAISDKNNILKLISIILIILSIISIILIIPIQIIVDKVIANYFKKVFNNFDLSKDKSKVFNNFDLSKDKFGIIKNLFNDFINRCGDKLNITPEIINNFNILYKRINFSNNKEEIINQIINNFNDIGIDCKYCYKKLLRFKY